MIDVNKELSKRLIDGNFSISRQDEYSREISHYEQIANGDVDVVKERLKTFGTTLKHGVLSPNSLQNSKYHAVILAAMASRFCIEKGMEISVSYCLSDIYIELIDAAKTIEEVKEISKQLTLDYTTRMQKLSKNSVVSRHIVVAIDYIRFHIQEPLTVESIADALSLNPSYLSKLFKQEMNMTISHYIREQKINIACNMLRHLDETSLNIANYLGFSSQSHFIQVFKKSVGVTPEEYRKRNFHQSWMNGDDN